MAGLMTGDRVHADSTGAVDADSILKSGVRAQPDVDAIAVRSSNTLSVMIWNYQDDDVTGSSVPVQLTVAGLPGDAHRVVVRHYRIDQDHSNAYTAWKQMGSPQKPSPEEYSKLEAAGQLQLLESPRWMDAQRGTAELRLGLPLQAISLIQVSW
jgi:xylan 1,4-beta-xylosidase